MSLQVVGAGVGRTGTHSLKQALETVLGGPCHHMAEVFAHPEEIPIWTDAIEGRAVDWDRLMHRYVAQVDWPGASFWPELLDATPTRWSSFRSAATVHVPGRIGWHRPGATRFT
jgi:Sulfotransferase domain